MGRAVGSIPTQCLFFGTCRTLFEGPALHPHHLFCRRHGREESNVVPPKASVPYASILASVGYCGDRTLLFVRTCHKSSVQVFDASNAITTTRSRLRTATAHGNTCPNVKFSRIRMPSIQDGGAMASARSNTQDDPTRSLIKTCDIVIAHFSCTVQGSRASVPAPFLAMLREFTFS